MGALLDELLEEVQTRELDEQVKIICDRITKEERPEGDQDYEGPLSPNIFLSLYVMTEEDRKGQKTHKYLALERDSVEVYVVTLWTRLESKDGSKISPLKKVNFWPVKEGKAEKILRFYAQYIQFLKGE